MATLDEARTTGDSAADHVSDHNALHTRYNDFDFDTTVPADGDFLRFAEGSAVSAIPGGGTSVSASNYYSTNTADKAFDGSTGTYWNSGDDGTDDWIKIDMGVAVDADQVRTYHDQAYYTYKIQTSDNDSDWTDRETGIQSINGWVTTNFGTPISARYWRIYCTATTGGQWWALFEVEINLRDAVWVPNSDLILPVKTDTGDPSSPSEGQVYVNTQDNKIRVYADSAWRDLATW